MAPSLRMGLGQSENLLFPRKAEMTLGSAGLTARATVQGSGVGFRGRVLLEWFLFCLLFCFSLFSAFLRLQQFFF